MMSIFRNRLDRPRIRVSLALGLLLMLPVLAASSVAARPMMNHDGHNNLQNCTSLCLRAIPTTAQEQGLVDDQQTPEPDPAQHDEQFFTGIAVSMAPQAIRPSPPYTTSPIRPPDIITQNGNFRF